MRRGRILAGGLRTPRPLAMLSLIMLSPATLLAAALLAGVGGPPALAQTKAPAAQASPQTPPQATPAEPPREPILRIETGAHTAPVARLAVDASGRLLASVSDDKTLRLWSLPDSGARGVLRPPIGPNEEGELYAVALSADGSRAFAAGSTGRSWDGAFSIYVFDTATGRLVARLPGLPAPVQHLALSPDGSRLAAALGGRAGIRVWDARSGRPVFEDAGYGGPARMVAFDAAGRLASTAADGKVRLYDPQGRRLAERVPVQGARPFGLALSPDGTLLAIGYEDRLRVEVLALPDLRSVLVPDVAGLEGEGLPAVAWAWDGRGGVQLHAAGYARGATAAPPAQGASAQGSPSQGAPSQGGRGVRLPPAPAAAPAAPRPAPPPAPWRGIAAAQQRDFVIRRWADFGLGPALDVPAARDSIAQLLPLPQGGLAFAAADPGWGRLAPDGALALAPRPGTGDFRATGEGLMLSPDGAQVVFALRADQPALRFDARTDRLEPAGPEVKAEGFAAGQTASARLSVTDWRNGNRPRLNGQPLRLGEGEFARALAILPDESGFLLGTDTHLRLFDPRGALLDAVPGPGATWGLAVSADGGVAVAAHADGTLRWYGVGGGRITRRGSLFVHADGRRWVLWTPEGLFDHAPSGGQELVGVHLNEGRTATPEWATFQQAYRALYAPDEVRARVAGQAPRQDRLGDLRARIGRTPVARADSLCAVLEDGSCTPIPWSSATVPPGTGALRLTVAAQDRGLGLGPMDVLVNGRIAARAEPQGAAASVEVPLDPGPNRIATRLYAEDRTLFGEGPSLDLRREGEAGPPPGAGRLVVLAVGVDRYAEASMNLRFAVADARTVVDTLRVGGAGLFDGVETTLLTDAEASRENILRALQEAATRVRPEDTFVLYLAGHGVKSESDGRFLFLPADLRDISSWGAIRSGALDDDALIGALARIRARDGFLLIDTCYAGQVALDSLSAMGNETGRYLLAASSSVQEALDSYDDRNGVFAFALREGLRGRAATDPEGRVSALALGEFVARRVPQLAREKQHDQNAVFRTASRDLHGFPLSQVAR
ncbi:caspase family protein [Roseomonas sp. OT10]|uniref:caspase family protein n=1 Tax=Roseomonas cutis TaxID=2897332 RepID=UPI001E45E719|nr:caspase family protein [Roseomonas sp. OT10]UFN47778.1 caspase family protein [Roseomonas sp. OT10]